MMAGFRILLSLAVGCLFGANLCVSHPLEDYVNVDDGWYTWEEINRTEDENRTTVIVLNMTSQIWMDESVSNHPVWWHYMIVAIPETISITDQAYILVGIGNLADPPPDPDDDLWSTVMRTFAYSSEAVSVYVSNIPNQPIVTGGVPRSEDDLISWTWATFLNMTEPKDPNILLYFPMVKAMVKAMDAATEVTLLERELNVTKYVIGGPSKRGWTAWLTAAADDRIVGLNPMVMSLLNMVQNLHHHYRTLGGWSWAFKDYFYQGLTEKLDDPEINELLLMQDPYEMRANLTMPKYIIKAGTDEFFMLDDFQHFLGDLPGITNILVLENSIHVMLDHWRRLVRTIVPWFKNVHRGIDRTYMTWTLQADESTASTVATTLEPAVNVTGWVVNTVEDSGSTEFTRRDFRWLRLSEANNINATEESNVTWVETPVENLGNDQYRLVVNAPTQGWTACIIVATFAGAEPDTYTEISTQPNIVPNTFAYPECVGVGCRGMLV